MPGTFRRDGQMCGEGCFASPALFCLKSLTFSCLPPVCKVARVHTCRFADVILCRCDVLHMEVKNVECRRGVTSSPVLLGFGFLVSMSHALLFSFVVEILNVLRWVYPLQPRLHL